MEFLLSAGNDNDCVRAVELLENIELCGSNVLADRAYGARSIREYLSEHGANYVIPPQSNMSNPWPIDWYPYKEWHLIECFSRKSSGFAELPQGMTSWTPPSWHLFTLLPLLFRCFRTRFPIFQTMPKPTGTASRPFGGGTLTDIMIHQPLGSDIWSF